MIHVRRGLLLNVRVRVGKLGSYPHCSQTAHMRWSGEIEAASTVTEYLHVALASTTATKFF